MKTGLSNFRRKNDGWNEFAGGASGAFLWGIFSIIPDFNLLAFVTSLIINRTSNDSEYSGCNCFGRDNIGIIQLGW